MRKRLVKNGLRFILAALLLIVAASFFHGSIAELLSLSYEAEAGFYRAAIFAAAVLGGFGVVRTVFGLLLSGGSQDGAVRLLPTLLLIIAVFSLFFYLLSTFFDSPAEQPRERLRPGDTITI